MSDEVAPWRLGMFSEVIGQTIVSAAVGENRRQNYYDSRGPGTRLTFNTREGAFVYGATADCCSESWIESHDPLDELAGATIVSIDQSYAETQSSYDFDSDGRIGEAKRQDVNKIDFVTLRTDRGYWKLEFRNASNGYYGGNMDLISKPGGIEDDD